MRLYSLLCFVSAGSSVLGTEDDLALSLRFMNFGTNPPCTEDDSGLSSFVENPQYFCGIIKDKDMCEFTRAASPNHLSLSTTHGPPPRR